MRSLVNRVGVAAVAAGALIPASVHAAAVEGPVQKQATNFSAIVMFLVFVLATLGNKPPDVAIALLTRA